VSTSPPTGFTADAACALIATCRPSRLGSSLCCLGRASQQPRTGAPQLCAAPAQQATTDSGMIWEEASGYGRRLM
jgi:hypothetical protein